MNKENEKATLFIGNLLSNPTLHDLTSLQREEQILQFLQVNGAKLFPTLSSSAFFPGRNIQEVNTILLSALFQITDSVLIPDLRTIIYERINYSPFAFMGSSQLNEQGIRFQLFTYIEKMVKRPAVRRYMTGPHRMITAGIAGKYLAPAFERRKYVLFELTKVQRLRMSQADIMNLILVSMLLMPAVHMMEAPGKLDKRSESSSFSNTSYVNKIIEALGTELSLVPEAVIRSSIHSNISCLENRTLEATARISSIFSAMGVNYKPKMKVDRGAVSADSSWFNIARKNYRYNGMDKDVLNELYNISVENGW